jgi:transcriptional regulator with XRE-family HTH domain
MKKRHLNKKLKLALLSAGMTQRELAVKAGTSESAISGIVRGSFIPDESLWSRICEVLECEKRKVF